MNDGGPLVFEQSGQPYPFEELAKYTLPRKRDRFTRDMLLAYLAAFGLAPLSDSFCMSTTVRDRSSSAIRSVLSSFS
jgi:hypothetical protein